MKIPKKPKSKPQPLNLKPLTKPKTKPKSIIIDPNPNETVELKAKFKNSDPDVQRFIEALNTENLKLHKQLAKCQAEKVSLESKIKVLTEEYSQYCHDHPPFDPSSMTAETKEAVVAYMKQLVEKQKHIK
ncbi:MAG: hypothetical protein KJ936_11075 [Proteobacteria bacterium]|nr:hypothetical protein [Pseudomonadota bacterium]MBU2228185.1 hypothetical protein [Pseudomonadota bacterium]